jgi:hypothetical protein
MLSREFRAQIVIRVERFFSGCDWRHGKNAERNIPFKNFTAWDIHQNPFL